MRVAALILAVAAAGCPGPECEEKADVVTMDGDWALLAPADDPFAPPADAELCTDEDVRVEPFGTNGPPSLDVDTRRGCGWATLRQDMAVDLAPGDQVQIRVFYFSQTSFPAAEAEIALRLGDEDLWSTTVPIPTGSQLEFPLVPVERDVPAGTPAYFHVGNHGDNTWNLLEVSRVRKVFCTD